MRRLLIAFALAAAALSASPVAAQQSDPLARARDGAVECYGPNVAARTCEGMVTYRVLDNGQIASSGIIFIQDDPTLIVYSTTSVYLRDGMVCERVQRSSIDDARITMDGAPAPEEVARAIRDAVWGVFVNVTEMCSRYASEGEAVDVTIYFDGVEQPEFADRLIWIRPEDGYTLGSANAEAA